jgi:hypothetical protein
MARRDVIRLPAVPRAQWSPYVMLCPAEGFLLIFISCPAEGLCVTVSNERALFFVPCWRTLCYRALRKGSFLCRFRPQTKRFSWLISRPICLQASTFFSQLIPLFDHLYSFYFPFSVHIKPFFLSKPPSPSPLQSWRMSTIYRRHLLAQSRMTRPK